MRELTPPIIESEYRELKSAKQRQDQKRKSDLRIRDVIAKERLFTLAYIALIVVTMIMGVVIGHLLPR